MGNFLTRRFARWLMRAAELPTPDYAKSSSQWWLPDQEIEINPIRTKDDQLRAYAGWVYVAASTTSFDVRQQEAAWWRMQGASQDDWEVIDDAKLPPVVLRPNLRQSWADLIETAVLHLDLTGEAYWNLISSGVGGKVEGIQSVYPQWIEDFKNGEWVVRVPGKTAQRIAEEDMVVFRYPHPSDPTRGMSPVEALALSHYLDLYPRAYAVTLAKNLGVPVGLLSVPKSNLTKDEADLEQQRWDDGVKTGHIRVIGNGAVYQPVGIPLKDLNFMAIANLSQDQIFASYKMPAAAAGLSKDYNRANFEAAMGAYGQLCIKPRCSRIDDVINTQVRPRLFDKATAAKVWYETAAPTNEDKDFTLRKANDLLTKGAIMVNEYLQMLGEPDKGAEGEVYYRPKNIDVVAAPNEVVEVFSEPTPPVRQTRSLAAKATDRDKARELVELRFLRSQEKLERSLKAQVRALFSKEQKAVIAKYKASGRGMRSAVRQGLKDAGIVTRDWVDDALDELAGEWRKTLEDSILQGLKDGWALFEAEFDEAVSFDIYSKEAAAWAKKQAGEKIKDILDTTKEKVRDLVSSAIEEGQTIEEITKAIGELYDGYKGYRAETIARTETATAVNSGQYEAAVKTEEELGLKLGKSWLATEGDDRTRETHAEADSDPRNQNIPLDQPFMVGDAELMQPGDPSGPPEETIQCFTGDTRVDTPGIVRAYRREYTGSVVKIRTALGHELTGTPNHPILTPFGWIALDALKEGDCVIGCILDQRVPLGNPDVQRTPSELHEVFDALTDGGPTERIASAHGDFHGDGIDGEVDVVRAKGKLFDGAQASRLEPLRKLVFTLTNLRKTSLLGEGALKCGDDGLWSALRGAMGSGNLPFSVTLAHPVPLEQLGITSGTGSNAGLEKQATDDLPGSSKVISNSLLGHTSDVKSNHIFPDARMVAGKGQVESTGQVAPLDSLGGELLNHAVQGEPESGGDLPHTQPVVVEFDRIVEVVRKKFSGHVFNLETVTGWYIGNNIVARNCRCTVLYDEVED